MAMAQKSAITRAFFAEAAPFAIAWTIGVRRAPIRCRML
jgi:hypothetical protein